MTVKDAVGIQRQAGDRQRASGPGLGLQTEPLGGKLPSRVAVRLEQALGELVPPYLLRRKHLPSGSAAETRAGGGEPRGQLPARASRDNGAGAKGLDTHAEAGGRRPERGSEGKRLAIFRTGRRLGSGCRVRGAGRLVSRRPAGRGRRGRNAPGKVAKLRKLKRSGRERREMATSKIWEGGAVARVVPLTRHCRNVMENLRFRPLGSPGPGPVRARALPAAGGTRGRAVTCPRQQQPLRPRHNRPPPNGPAAPAPRSQAPVQPVAPPSPSADSAAWRRLR